MKIDITTKDNLNNKYPHRVYVDWQTDFDDGVVRNHFEFDVENDKRDRPKIISATYHSETLLTPQVLRK